jgi:hypothetical protein
MDKVSSAIYAEKTGQTCKPHNGPDPGPPAIKGRAAPRFRGIIPELVRRDRRQCRIGLAHHIP